MVKRALSQARTLEYSGAREARLLNPLQQNALTVKKPIPSNEEIKKEWALKEKIANLHVL